MARALVVGGGVFGVTASIALRSRGHAVTLVDPGPLPHPLAESTDISKIVRLDYGSDEGYTVMMETALDGWRRWNRAWRSRGARLFHETGVMFLTQQPMAPGGFEHESHALLERRGHRPERLDARSLRARFPLWNTGRFCDGYFNPEGGWAESGAVVSRLLGEALDAGVRLAPQVPVARLVEEGDRVTGVVAKDGTRIDAELVVVAAGSWTKALLPWLAPYLRSVGQPVFHLAPHAPELYDARTFPVFGADISRTGYYGFPLHRGVVKIANHGVGREMHPESSERAVTAAEEEALRAFLRDALPSLAEAPLESTRVCVYGDSLDHHFWIAPDPDRRGLVVAAGGSGHAFKFAPLVGGLIADAVEGRVDPRFRWRTDVAVPRGDEQARHRARS